MHKQALKISALPEQPSIAPLFSSYFTISAKKSSPRKKHQIQEVCFFYLVCLFDNYFGRYKSNFMWPQYVTHILYWPKKCLCYCFNDLLFMREKHWQWKCLDKMGIVCVCVCLCTALVLNFSGKRSRNPGKKNSQSCYLLSQQKNKATTRSLVTLWRTKKEFKRGTCIPSS